MTGYLHELYAQSLSEFGVPQRLPRSDTWILSRDIESFPHKDSMGCYPLFICSSWDGLFADLEEIGNELVSLTVVTDPFADSETTLFRRCFKDLVRPFKEHFVTDLGKPMEDYVSVTHRRYARRALEAVDVERVERPTSLLEEWLSLYEVLIHRHGIVGIPAFSGSAFSLQLRVPGLVALRASREAECVGILLWYVYQDVAYYHLGAFSAKGYALRAAYALFWRSIEYFRSVGLRWLHLGSAAGASVVDPASGLNQFKRGWSTGTRTAYLCGRIFNPDVYASIVKLKSVSDTDYFPAYRCGEFQ